MIGAIKKVKCDSMLGIFKNKPAARIRITKKNLNDWPAFKEAHDEGKVIFDRCDRLRYKHGAPVGDMLLSRLNENGAPIYRESAEEWFDPESRAAKEFKWP